MSEDRIDTMISDDIVFRGRLKFENSLKVKGIIKGTIDALGSLIIEEGGRVDADVNVASLVVNGVLNGNAEVKDKIEIGKTGVVVGDVKSPVLSIEAGAKFTGNSSM
ncbi:MAG: polymer-forming cytoskeletal protein [Leptospiraceae bacterium]|nr:polymer-forming cytoskeletal protein [Leptospiraceae bacterium]